MDAQSGTGLLGSALSDSDADYRYWRRHQRLYLRRELDPDPTAGRSHSSAGDPTDERDYGTIPYWRPKGGVASDLGMFGRIFRRLAFHQVLLKRAYTRREFEQLRMQRQFRSRGIEETRIRTVIRLESDCAQCLSSHTRQSQDTPRLARRLRVLLERV